MSQLQRIHGISRVSIQPVNIAGSARVLAPIAPAREGGSLTLQFSGQPGDRVYAIWNPSAAWTDAPTLHGLLLIAAPYRRRFLGIADGTGQLTASIPVFELGAGVQGTVNQMQLVGIDAANQSWISGSSAAVRLDAAF